MRPSKLLVVLADVAGLTTSAATTPPEAAAQTGGDWIDTLDREAVLSACTGLVFDPLLASPGWDGNVGTCRGGNLSLAFRRSIQARIDYFRRMAGVDGGVIEDSGFSVRAQEAALLMAANGSFNPNPPETWACWSEPGDDGGPGRSCRR